MIYDIRIRGFVGDKDRYEYYVNVVGGSSFFNVFYEQDEDQHGKCDRFFHGGNELALYQEHIYHQGNGGSFCEYMLGQTKPSRDYLRPEVQNRLVMFGARYDEENIVFTNETAARERFERVFREGNLLCNYFFFISGDIQGELRNVQETIIKHVGKFLKRTPLYDDVDGSRIAVDLYEEIGVKRWKLVLLKIIDRFAVKYKEQVLQSSAKGTIPQQERERLSVLASELGISCEDADRIECDTLYKYHPSNRKLIQEYKELLSLYPKDEKEQETFQLKRVGLRDLARKRGLPLVVFDQLDSLATDVPKIELPEYVQDAKRFLEMLLEKQTEGLTGEELIELFCKRLSAFENNYGFFGELLEGVSNAVVDCFGSEPLRQAVKVHLERYEKAYEIARNIVQIDGFELNSERLSFLAAMKGMMDLLGEGTFERLVLAPVEKHCCDDRSKQLLDRLRTLLSELLCGRLLADEVETSLP
ncbi:MAG: TIGR04442 family protein [Acidobacteriota bacterium]|nr:TIGR04442 family protein [Blastocatellia bacterium]MDW8412201.1 TIGR04442 family protein [Acidobacteriota bacterium]